jgi:diguanylate cyclase (GGDEF)-like protein/PAS domain S-box-containing protein
MAFLLASHRRAQPPLGEPVAPGLGRRAGLARWRRRIRFGLGSLKLRITVAAVVALLLGIGLITLLLVRQAERSTLVDDNERELSEVVRTASALSRRVVDLQKALQVTARQMEPGVVADGPSLAAFMRSQPALRGWFSSLFVAWPDGRVALLADDTGLRDPQVNLGDRAYFQRTLREGRAIVSEPVPSRISAEPVVVLTQPVWRGGEIVAVLAGGIRLASRDLLIDVVDAADAADGGAGALVVVTDASGRIVAHPDRSRLMQPLASERRLAQAFGHWTAAGAAVEPGGMRLNQAGEVVSLAGVVAADWLVWRALPEDGLLAPLRSARAQALAWAAGLVVLLSALLLFWLTWLLRPLRQLEDRAQHLFDAQAQAREGWPVGSGEIGRLARVLRHVGAERAQLEALNHEVLQKLGSVMSAAPVGIAFTRERRFELVSAELCRLLGRREDELLGQQAQLIFASNEDYMALGQRVPEAFGAGRSYVGEWPMLRANGSRFWGQLRGRPVDAACPESGTIWTISDVTDQVAARERLEWSAMHDPLTGAANRKALDLRLSRLFDGLPDSLPAELVVIDLDHFKPINDSGGHAAGDAMLTAVAHAIGHCVRTGDLVVRTGGDEFAVLLERCTHDAALRVAESVRVAISAIVLPWGQHSFGVGASIGVASLHADTPGPQAWLAEADAACYAVKASGRGTVRGGGHRSPPRA